MSPDVLRHCWILAGPTAAGKSAVALELGLLINAEIVNLDSMTLYRGMDIGTAKPTAADRELVPHHLLDILNPDQEFSLAEYLQAAETACRDILHRGKIPLFVGGTGLYLRGLLRGIFTGPPADWGYRESLATASDDTLHSRLNEVDPPSAQRLHPRDRRRVIRALEVWHLTGIPLSQQQEQQAPRPQTEWPQKAIWLNPDRPWLHARINARVTAMLEQGWLDEVRRLQQSPGGLGRTASQALGYRELADHLAGRSSLAEATTEIQTRTRQFAKRQYTWFRHLEECQSWPVTGEEGARELAASMVSGAERMEDGG